MVEPPLSDYEVVRFLVNRGGRCTNYELVSNFRGILNDPQHQAEARLKFKDIINTVATVGEFQNVKYIELKKDYCPSNSDRPRNEDFGASGFSSLSSESSDTSSYSSPLTQSFQPYWRYRLSTSPQLPPPRKPSLDAIVQSPSSKSINRSISESTLPPDVPLPPRTKTTRAYSEEKQPKTVTVTNHQPPLWHRDYENRSHSSIVQPPQYLDVPTDHRRYSSGYYPLEHSSNNLNSNSLPYYPHETEFNQNVFESKNGITSSRENCPSMSRKTASCQDINRYRPSYEKQSDLSFNDSYRGKQTMGTQLNAHIHPQSRNFYDDKYLPQPELFCSNKISYNQRSPSSCELRESMEQKSPRRKSLDLSRIEQSASNRTPHLNLSDNNWGNGEEDDVFADPNYLRTVSKLCLEKNKATLNLSNHRSSTNNSPETQFGNRIDSKSRNFAQKEFFTNETTKSENPLLSNEFIRKNNCNEQINNIPEEYVAPMPPERRRKSHENSLKITKELSESRNNIEYNEKDSNSNEIVPNKVKDRVQHFDEMGKKQKKIILNSSDKENKVSIKSTSMEDDVSISVLDPKLKKEWFVKASQCDYHALVALLKKEPKLAALKDIASGYTALHWAAKHGDANVVKLIAGAYKVNPNIRSNGGYTPVHLASLYKHDMISHLLIHTYGADSSLRDYNGKRADQYPNDYIRNVAGQKNVERRPLKQRPLVAKETISNSFMRIGSLNLRKARKSAVFASVRGNSRNRSSASDLRFGNQGSTRKKLHKKESLLIDKKTIVEKRDDDDSDSAYGFPSKKLES